MHGDVYRLNMDNQKRILEYLKRVQAIAKTGLTYALDPYDVERYEELRDTSSLLLAELSDAELPEIAFFFGQLDSYPTPKVDVRGVVIQQGKILLIQEKSDGKWAMPGGWADIGHSPSENIVKEVSEEAGLLVKVDRLLAVWDKRKHDHPDDIHSVYKLNFLCKTIGGSLKPGHEALDAGFFDLNQLPPLSLMRNTEAQIRRLHALATGEEVDFD